MSHSTFNLNKLKEKKPANLPYVSVNKLAEYMEANPVRRRQIIKNLKEDNTFIKARYSKVRIVLEEYFRTSYDKRVINDAIDAIQGTKHSTSWDENDFDNSILALESLRDIELPSMEEYEVFSHQPRLDKVELAGMNVGLKPDIYLKNIITGKISAIKFHIAKTEDNRLSEIPRQYVATMLRYGFLNQGFLDKQIDNNMCLSVDIFSGDYSSAPASYRKSLHSLTASCEEIIARWDTL